MLHTSCAGLPDDQFICQASAFPQSFEAGPQPGLIQRLKG